MGDSFFSNPFYKEYFCVPKAIMGELSNCSKENLKALLYLYSSAQPSFLKDAEKIKEELNMDVDEFLFFLSYWMEKGVLSGEEIKGLITSLKAEPREPEKKHFVSDELPEYMPKEIETSLANDHGVKMLYEKSQQILGKMISPTDFNKIYGFHEFLGIEVDAVIMLLEYCRMTGKTNLRYIEKIAVDWANNNIMTGPDAEEYIKQHTDLDLFKGRIKRLLSIDRGLSPSEEGYIAKWQRFSMEDDLIALAYDKTVMNTGKCSFPYMNSILESWNVKGYTKKAEVLEEKKPSQKGVAQKTKRIKKIDDSNFDYDEFTRLSREFLSEGDEGE